MIQRLSRGCSAVILYPVTPDQGHNRKSKVSWVLQLPVSIPEPQNKSSPVIDISRLNIFLKVENFKMETQESVRAFLIAGEWVTSVKGGSPSHETFSLAPQRELEYPRSLDGHLPWPETISAYLGWWQKCPQHAEGFRPSSQRSQNIDLYLCLKRRLWHCSLSPAGQLGGRV